MDRVAEAPSWSAGMGGDMGQLISQPSSNLNVVEETIDDGTNLNVAEETYSYTYTYTYTYAYTYTLIN